MLTQSTLARAGARIALAAIVLLALIQLHGAIVQQMLRLAGLGLDGPVLLRVSDRCGKKHWLPPALQVFGTEPLTEGCELSAEALALLPTDEAYVLFLDGSGTYRPIRAGRFAWFRNLQLMPGVNRLTVAGSNTGLLYPYAVRDAREIITNLNAEMMRSIGLTVKNFDVSGIIFLATPNVAEVQVAKPENAATGAPDAEAPRPVSRTLTLSREPDGVVAVRAEACLPPTHPLARRTNLSGPQFLAMVFQAAVSGPALPLSDPRWNQIPQVITSYVTPTCTKLRTEYRIERGEVSFIGGADFLTLPGDVLRTTGLADALAGPSRPADHLEGDVAVWVGSSQSSGQVIFVPPSLAEDHRDSIKHGVLSVPASVGETGGGKPWVAEGRQGLVAALSGLRELLPGAWSAALGAAAAAAPVALLLWAVERAWARAESARLRRARAALIALFAFMATFAALPLLLGITQWLLHVLGPIGFYYTLGTPLVSRGFDSDISAPSALCAVLMIVPIMQDILSPPQRSHRRLSGVFAALVSVALLIVALVLAKGIQILMVMPNTRELLQVLPADLLPVDPTLVERAPGPVAGIVGFGLWTVLGLSLFWVPVYWLFCNTAPSASVLGASWVAGLALFLLPLSSGLLDVAATTGLVAGERGGLWAPAFALADSTRSLATIVTAGFPLLVVTLVLRAFREVTASLLDANHADFLRRNARTSLLFLAAVIVVWPIIDRSWAEPQALNMVVYRLMTFFQAFGALLALLAVLAAAQDLDERQRNAPTRERFALPSTVLAAVSAAFAGYLTLWNREPIAVAVLMIVGWGLFRHFVLAAPNGATIPSELPGKQGVSGGKRLVDYLEESRLLRARRTAIDKLFSEGKLSEASQRDRRNEIEKRQRSLDEQLGMPVADAKLQLFALGPGGSPLQNGYRGALAGIVVALMLQLLVPFNISPTGTEVGPNWIRLASKLMTDPQYQVVAVSERGSRILVLLSEALNAFAIWTIAGFIFGYVFHRIRGRDGFLRALAFGVGVSVPYLLSQALIAPAAGVPIETAARITPLLVFLLIVGTLVFDGAVLRREGVDRAKLLEVYGLRTSVGYVSFAGALAGLKPLLDLVDLVVKR